MKKQKLFNLFLAGFVLVLGWLFILPNFVSAQTAAKGTKKEMMMEKRLEKTMMQLKKKSAAMEKEMMQKKAKIKTQTAKIEKRLSALKKKRIEAMKKKEMKKAEKQMSPAAAPKAQIKTMTMVSSAVLTDVIGGGANGLVQIVYSEGAYSLSAVFSNLPELKGTEFYEGWIAGDLGILSTGKAQKAGVVYTNMFKSDKDFTKNTKYILTLEPDESDPAPATTHILEGTLVKR